MHDSWSDISMQEVNPMMVHEPHTLQSYIGSNQKPNLMMMDIDQNLPQNITIAANNVKFEAKMPTFGRKCYFFEHQTTFYCIY